MKYCIVVIAAVLCASAVLAGDAGDGRSPVSGLSGPAPLIPVNQDYALGPYWRRFRPGDPGYPFGRDFYFAEQGNYVRTEPGRNRPYVQTGLWPHFIPGHWNLHYFDPENYRKAPPVYKQLVDAWRRSRWPLHTIQYHVMYGKPMPTQAAIKAAGNLWIGDNMPEAPIYRLDFLFEFLHTGKWREKGSSVRPAMHQPMTAFLAKQLLPRLKRELPFCQDPDHQWSHWELRRLKDIYCEEFFRDIGKPVAWGMFVSPFFLASLPQTVCVAEKGADAFKNARARGVMRQSGGSKFYFTWRGHEPTERYGYFLRGWYSAPGREEWGYPLPHLWYYMFRPFLIGANYSIIESMPGSLVQDVEGDGQYELSTLGHIAESLFDFIKRHPDRGTPYAPVALLRNYNRPNSYGMSRFQWVKPDDGEYMNHGLLRDLIFPEHRHTKFSGSYSVTAPYGEIFDILAPNLPGRAIDPKIFAGYKVLFALGGQEIDRAYAEALKQYMQGGGTLVINVMDLGKFLAPSLFGVELAKSTVKGAVVKDEQSGRLYRENPFTRVIMQIDGAQTLYSCNGEPLITRNRVGRGYAVLIGAEYMVQNALEKVVIGRGRKVVELKPLLKFVPDFLARLTAGLTPFEIMVRPENRPDISWLINQKEDGWQVILFNYSLKREELIARTMGTAKVIAEYPYKSVPFKIVCSAPMADVIECYEDRDVHWSRQGGAMVISESIRGGDIRVYEFQPHRIVLPARQEAINFALQKQVSASSTLKGFSAQAAVDGRLDNNDFWQSDLDAKRHYVFDLPQWLQVDLGEVRTIDHIFVLFHTWPHATLMTRQHIYKYRVEASVDKRNWRTVIDETNNEDPARPEGLERWFTPTPARYVRLTVLRNSAEGGAKVVELKVMGTETESVRPKRKSIVPKWHVRFPAAVALAHKDKVRYLMHMKPTTVKPGWLPAGKTWKQMNGWVRLYTDFSQNGAVFKHSLYGESVSEIVYKIPANARIFASAIGLGNRHRKASVVFKVFVDGQEKYNSKLYRLGCPVLPVVLDVQGGKELKLVVEDGGDGINYDYAWWGDARFVLK